ncbi:MAG: MgtC/SapB family protein [Ignavibacteriaceae bacterium]|jgi:putative Mg2+ transporter-C (MgtC) family protein|nr:MgtC/SapB family protein [Ignavibacteriaceae bacterium]
MIIPKLILIIIIMTYLEFALRLFTGLGAGMIIGFERQWQHQHRSAGLRTNTLVATGAALFVLLSVNLTQNNGDVTRIIGQVVTGIGFLGAGIIFKEGNNIIGLSTAVTVWCSAAVGSLAGAGYYVETLIGVVAVLTVNTILMPVDKWLSKRKN